MSGLVNDVQDDDDDEDEDDDEGTGGGGVGAFCETLGTDGVGVDETGAGGDAETLAVVTGVKVNGRDETGGVPSYDLLTNAYT